MTLAPARKSIRETKSGLEVQAMLYDIATAMRLTALVKGEMLRDKAEADRKQLEANRANRAQQLEAAFA